jgi:hypothetical protein
LAEREPLSPKAMRWAHGISGFGIGVNYVIPDKFRQEERDYYFSCGDLVIQVRTYIQDQHRNVSGLRENLQSVLDSLRIDQ